MPSRSAAIAALYAANSTPKVAVPEPTVGRPAAPDMTGSAGAVLRIRDRATVAQKTTGLAAEPLSRTEQLIADQERERLADIELQRRKAAGIANRERREKEAREKANRERLKRENDRIAMEQHRARVSEHLVLDSIKQEVKSIFQTMDAYDIVPEVMALVKSWKMEQFPLAYETAIKEIRAKK